MSWLTELIRPRIKSSSKQNDLSNNLWKQCPSCKQMVFHRDVSKKNEICPICGYHFRLNVEKRLSLLLDKGFSYIKIPETPIDPLKFKDIERYTDRLKKAKNKTKHTDALLIVDGRIHGIQVIVAAFDFNFMGGSMGIAVGEGIVQAVNLALTKKCPFIIIPSSGGARMQEGILSLMQMPRTIIAITELKEARIPYFVILTDPTTGGVSASFAMLGDIHITEPGATIGFAGRRVIQQTVKEILPDDFQKSEFLYDHGMIDIIVQRDEIKDILFKLISLLIYKKQDYKNN